MTAPANVRRPIARCPGCGELAPLAGTTVAPHGSPVCVGTGAPSETPLMALLARRARWAEAIQVLLGDADRAARTGDEVMLRASHYAAQTLRAYVAELDRRIGEELRHPFTECASLHTWD